MGQQPRVAVEQDRVVRRQHDVGDAVDVAVHEGTVIVTPIRRVRGGHDLHALIRRIPKGYKLGELDWGLPVGREVW